MPHLRSEDLMAAIEPVAGTDQRRFPQLLIREQLPVIGLFQRVDPRPPLIGHTLYQRLWVAINTLLRHGAAHAVEPVVAQQNEFNATLASTIEQLVAADSALRGTVVAATAQRIVADEQH